MSLKIPRMFHRIWLGGKPMPELFQQWGESWTRLNPGWTMTTWTEENLRTRFPDLIARACHLSQRSNVYRYEILLDHGGIYLDTDFECLKPIDSLLDNVDAFVCLKKYGKNGRLLNSILGAVPNHHFSRRLVDNLRSQDPAKPLSMGSLYATNHLASDPSGVKIFNPEIFCPIHHVEVKRLGQYQLDAKQLYPNAYGIHHWSSTIFPSSFELLA